MPRPPLPPPLRGRRPAPPHRRPQVRPRTLPRGPRRARPPPLPLIQPRLRPAQAAHRRCRQPPCTLRNGYQRAGSISHQQACSVTPSIAAAPGWPQGRRRSLFPQGGGSKPQPRTSPRRGNTPPATSSHSAPKPGSSSCRIPRLGRPAPLAPSPLPRRRLELRRCLAPRCTPLWMHQVRRTRRGGVHRTPTGADAPAPADLRDPLILCARSRWFDDYLCTVGMSLRMRSKWICGNLPLDPVKKKRGCLSRPTRRGEVHRTPTSSPPWSPVRGARHSSGAGSAAAAVVASRRSRCPSTSCMRSVW